MESTTSAADRRKAHLRVGATAAAAFVALLLLGAINGSANASPAVPAATPSGQSTQPAPSQTDPSPSQTDPTQPSPGQTEPSFPRRDRGGFGHRGGGFGGGQSGGGFPGGGAAPAPSTSGGSQT
jgi:hypothetical protein